jgi:FlaA1/EpsC-like NDP-sugar epimerase
VTSRRPDPWFDRLGQFAAVCLSVAGAFSIRFEAAIPAVLTPIVKHAVWIAVLVKLPIFEMAGFYRGLRRFVSLPDLQTVFLGNVAASMGFAAAVLFLIGPEFPRSVLVLDAVLCFLATALVRFSARIYGEAFRRRAIQPRTGILIYGAGAAGAELVREIHANRNSRYVVRGFLDDDRFKQKAVILGVPVLGTGREALSVVQRLNRRKPAVEEIIIAMRSVSGPQMREVLANCRAVRIPCKTLPGIDEFLSGKVLTAHVRNLSLQDLLGRQLVRLDDEPVRASIAGRSILVTGAAGSIGSEICRQVARFNPACLVAFDKAESDLFRIECELRENFPGIEVVTALGDICDHDRVSEVIDTANVDSLFHAAAYKHVPMMESHVIEAVRNNILGTWNVLRTARRQSVRNLLLISSDKAVNPICVMGATKRACERLVLAKHPDSETRCVSVRFGNVLGSNGSVVPIFQSQIASGGPVRVTHPEARRFFMTVSEAVSLTLQASTRSQGSEIFVLDMGEPIRIVDLAENMIRLAGMIPYEDIEIQFTGLRPGEKLIEEVNGSSEDLLTTNEQKMCVIRDEPLSGDVAPAWIDGLRELLAARRPAPIIAHLRSLVPEYEPAGIAQTATEPNGLRSEPLIVCEH